MSQEEEEEKEKEWAERERERERGWGVGGERERERELICSQMNKRHLWSEMCFVVIFAFFPRLGCAMDYP